jgi:hypothetical protein
LQLTLSQCQFFNAFGYLALPKLFSPAEIERIADGFERSIQAFGGGRTHNGSRRTMFGGPIEHLPEMCTVLDDERILGAAGSLIGPDFNYTGGDGNYYTGDTGWHPDGGWGQLFAIKLAFYLDPVSRDTGCLRVIPGSHEPGHPVRQRGIDPNKAQELYGVHPRDFPGNVALETQPGDLVIFNHDTYHASYGGGARRRMFTMNLTRRARTPSEQTMMRAYTSVHSAGGYKVNVGGNFFMPLIETASPARMAHLEQVIALHDELFPQYAKRRPHAEQVGAMVEALAKL